MYSQIDPALLLARLEARREELGALRTRDDEFEPLSWVEVALQVGTHSATFSRLKAGRLPGDETMGRILTWLGIQDPFDLVPDPDATMDAEGEDMTVTGTVDLPVADRDHDWDGDQATRNVFDAHRDEEGNVDVEAVSKAFLYRDPEKDATKQDAYKLGFADIIDGALTIVPEAVISIATVLNGGRAGVKVPDDEKAQLRSKTCSLYDHISKSIEDFPECPLTKGEPDEDNENSLELLEGGGCGCEHSVAVADVENPASKEKDPDDGKTAAIFGIGRLSDSNDSDTQALVARAKELMLEGAAGVSIKHDMNPEDMPDPDLIDQLLMEGRYEELDALLEDVHARPRHVALVDTAAFSDARLVYDEESGEVSGPVVFEGHWTGDMRRLPYGTLVWDDVLPIPITMGHEGPGGTQPPIIGFIDSLERQDGVSSAMRGPEVTEKQVTAVAAAAGTSGTLPAKYFEKWRATNKTPLHVDAPDANGLRRVWGHIVPNGVCHRSDMGACFQYPADVDKSLSSFHTGMVVPLDDGTSVRPGALTFSGLHVDTSLASRGLSYREANRHREDTTKVFAMVKAWPDQFGLAVSGVLSVDISPTELLQVLACSPSVELWPSGRGRTLVGAHIVPTPAWPVAASAGSAMEFYSTDPIEIDEPPVMELVGEAGPELTTTTNGTLTNSTIHYSTFDAKPINDRLERIEKALAMLVQDKIADGIPEPEATE